MRKAAFIILTACLMLLAGACSYKHGIGYVNKEISWRMAIDDIKTEVSLGVNVQNDFDNAETDLPGLYYKSEETGSNTADIWLNAAVYYRLFKNDIFDLSAGLKYGNNFRVLYDYTYYYQAYTGLRVYHYDENFAFNFFSENKLSLMLPDVEFKCPFSDNIKFTLSVELLYLKWNYNGGKYTSRFTQDVSTVAGSYTETFTEQTEATGAVNKVETGSGLIYPGSINIGMMYYF